MNYLTKNSYFGLFPSFVTMSLVKNLILNFKNRSNQSINDAKIAFRKLHADEKASFVKTTKILSCFKLLAFPHISNLEENHLTLPPKWRAVDSI